MSKIRFVRLFITAGCTSLILAGCFNNKVEQEIAEVKKENNAIRAEAPVEESEDLDEAIENGDISIEDIELDEEQVDVLENSPQVSSEEALENLNEEIEYDQVDLRSITAPEFFDNPEELAQYMADYFFQLHTGQINGEEFSSAVTPYAHSDFLAMIPESEHDRADVFETISELFIEQLTSPIQSYQLTNLEFIRNEAIVYRKYIQKDLRSITYMTAMIEEDGVWKLLDDRPAEDVVIKPSE